MNLKFTPYVWSKMLYLRDLGDTEVSFMGISNKDDLSLVEDIVMLPQRCSGAYTEAKDGECVKFMEEQFDLYGIEPYRCMRIWCHTHPGNSVTPSGTDETTFKNMFNGCDWAIMFILGKNGSTSCRISYNHSLGGFGSGGSAELPTAIDWGTEFPASDRVSWKAEYDRTVENIVHNRTQWGQSIDFSGEHIGGFYNFRTKMWEPRQPFQIGGFSNVPSVPVSTKKESLKGLTKRERKYVGKHGSLAGYQEPTNPGYKRKAEEPKKQQLVKLENIQREDKLFVARNLLALDDLDEIPLNEADSLIAEELLDEALDDVTSAIDALEFKREFLEEQVRNGLNMNVELEDINSKLANLEVEWLALTGGGQFTDDGTEPEWLIEAQEVIEEGLFEKKEEPSEVSKDTALTSYSYMDQDEDFYKHYY